MPSLYLICFPFCVFSSRAFNCRHVQNVVDVLFLLAACLFTPSPKIGGTITKQINNKTETARLHRCFVSEESTMVTLDITVQHFCHGSRHWHLKRVWNLNSNRQCIQLYCFYSTVVPKDTNLYMFFLSGVSFFLSSC